MPNLKGILILVMAVAFVSVSIMSIFPTIGNTSISNSSTVIAVNDTVYPLGNPIYLSAPYTPTINYANGTAVSNYTYTTHSYKVGSNIATPATYYLNYTYYTESWLGGVNYGWVIGVIIFLGLLAVALKIVGWI